MKADLTVEQAQQLSLTNKLGKTVYSDKEFNELIQTYTDLFTGLTDTSDLSAILAKAKMQLLEFATKGIARKDADYSRANDFVNKRTEDTFARINGYWEMLLKNER